MPSTIFIGYCSLYEYIAGSTGEVGVAVSLLERLVERFVVEVGYGRSVDWYLIKLSSIAYEIEDLCRHGECNPMDLFRDFLGDKRVQRMIEPLSCYRDEVISLIRGNPRFKVLRRYVDIIESTLESIPCREKREIEVVPRPATWVIEERLEKPLKRRVLEKPELVSVSGERGRDLEKLITYVVVLVFILGVILILYTVIK